MAIDALVDSDEYRQNFGDYIVPYQRRRYKNVRLIWLIRATEITGAIARAYTFRGLSFYQARTGESLKKWFVKPFHQPPSRGRALSQIKPYRLRI